MNWCLYHSEQAQFLGPVTESRMPGPAGRYTCCGQQAFRYETLPGPMVRVIKVLETHSNMEFVHRYFLFQGCQYREHTVQIFSDRDRAILKLAQVAAEGNCLYEVPPNKLLKMGVSNETWWNGIILTPTKERPGLLPQIVFDGMFRRKTHLFLLLIVMIYFRESWTLLSKGIGSIIGFV